MKFHPITEVFLHLIVFTLCLSLAHCNVYEEFLNFIKKYGKTYKEGSKEFKQRFLNFQVSAVVTFIYQTRGSSQLTVFMPLSLNIEALVCQWFK